MTLDLDLVDADLVCYLVGKIEMVKVSVNFEDEVVKYQARMEMSWKILDCDCEIGILLNSDFFLRLDFVVVVAHVVMESMNDQDCDLGSFLDQETEMKILNVC